MRHTLRSWASLLCGIVALTWAAAPLAAQSKLKPGTYAHFTTSEGNFTIRLFDKEAPKTVENFVALAEGTKEWTDPRSGQKTKKPYYDGLIFHRVIDGFMIQGGGLSRDFVPKPTRAPIRNEAHNGLKNLTGTVAMARTMDPHSATAQFFINVSDNAFLDYPGQDGWGYCVFGQVVEGMDTVNAIKGVGTGSRQGHQDVPREDVYIECAEILP
jgi:peptidyl-prolyl cis-trans isomerase B (cyclophilin B)